jgi:peptide-methionine (S)-S-oxide reductase
VDRVIPGYCGGHRPNPSYEQICTGVTGHAEVVAIHFDPTIITFRQILEIFFAIHDPTTLNRQGNDIGTQYRSVIFCQSDRQRDLATALIDELRVAKAFPAPVVTEIAANPTFYPAEAYHHQYFARNPQQGYCQFVVAPKVLKFRQYFKDWQK